MGEDQEEDRGGKCPTCNGKGWIVLLVSRDRCPDCHGSGHVGGRFDEDEGTLDFDDETTTPPRGIKT